MVYHAAHFTENPARETVWKVLAGHLAPYVREDGDVLELGAAYCHWINHVRARRRVAMDIWADLPGHAGPGVEPVVGDLRETLPAVAAGSFDTVLASNLLEHFEPDQAASLVREIHRVLRPSGRVILIQPNFASAMRHYFDDYTHRAVFSHVSLPALLRASGFAIDEVRARFLPYSMRETRLPIMPWMIRAYLWSPIKPSAGQMLVVAAKESHVR
jgi:SAM-dependent methyltransferase